MFDEKNDKDKFINENKVIEKYLYILDQLENPTNGEFLDSIYSQE